eukprot:scaffold397132_cov15-Prasinocladus_malaysianus.AAC.1
MTMAPMERRNRRNDDLLRGAGCDSKSVRHISPHMAVNKTILARQRYGIDGVDGIDGIYEGTPAVLATIILAIGRAAWPSLQQ